MTEKEAMESPLHEVWERFKGNAAAIIMFWNAVADTHPDKAKAILLRKVLLKRCDNHLLDMEEPDAEAGSERWEHWHREMAAYHSFYAWELMERRRREIGMGDSIRKVPPPDPNKY